MEARMLREPGGDACVLVGLVVVEDQMQVELGRELAIEGAQELEELLVAVAGQALADDAAIESAERREERGGAVALVVMGQRTGAARLHGQARLSAIERLDLALLINAEHQRLLGRVQVEADHVGELFGEERVARELERPDTVRLKTA